MWQAVIVVFIVAIAFFYVIRRFMRSLKSQGASACGNCSAQDCGIQEISGMDTLSRSSGSKSLNRMNNS
ncbi:MAG: FeoB-associated Cys-rich membrane protein [Deltaproteobacteria bacterium]|nr:FeoB-associated Cys-rich membrane protein [Deltaproteobacteria bacterium]MBW2051278.1 FeoB-associated Cys-rich membrane protein [Deltaproteobacteria bacterium]MBW2139912.1 FeoB-associated Cys-rich membrane protein [Deltaproteobacteria bacterium]MBW2322377.1 FeoB-associated Cys-rich membrane protein [Deltaproteobacteria bacterium]